MTPRPALSREQPSLTCWGAAQAVTGSMHLVEAAGRRVLLDCGLARGPHAEVHLPSGGFPFAPRSLDAVILTHAHVDHCGCLPALVRQGFDGPIYCTAATRDLAAVMLADSARIQEEKALFAYVTGRSAPADAPYTRLDADQAVRQCVPVRYDLPVTIGNTFAFRLVDAGHLLGSAMVALTVAGLRRDSTLTFTGDLGRPGLPLHGPPSPVPAADLLLSESTYGGRAHDPVPQTVARLSDIARRTVARGGKVLVPAFSLGRTQLVLYALQGAMERGELAPVDVFVDSPLAAEITAVYRAHPGLLPPGVSDTEAFLGGPHVHYVRTREESRDLAERDGPCVIVAASGMCDAGRILHHLKRNVDDPRASVVLVSYQAPQTVGHRLLERGPTVRIQNRTWNKWAEVHELNGFSGHADQADFLALLGPLAGRVGKVRLVHGEPEAAAALAAGLRAAGFADVDVPERGQRIEID
jgi:metallo-beta-lactamase family protein